MDPESGQFEPSTGAGSREVSGETLHEGRRLEGGGLCWFASDDTKEESFFERVIKRDGKTFYEIHGFGIYGKDRSSAFYFEGSYEKVD